MQNSKPNKNILKKNKGQITMEAVLLLGVMSFAGLAIREWLDKTSPLSKFLSGTQWQRIDTMSKYAVIMPTQSPGQTSSLKTKHPNNPSRYTSRDVE